MSVRALWWPMIMTTMPTTVLSMTLSARSSALHPESQLLSTLISLLAPSTSTSTSLAPHFILHSPTSPLSSPVLLPLLLLGSPSEIQDFSLSQSFFSPIGGCLIINFSLSPSLSFDQSAKNPHASKIGSRVAPCRNYEPCLTTVECPGFGHHPHEMSEFLRPLLLLFLWFIYSACRNAWIVFTGMRAGGRAGHSIWFGLVHALIIDWAPRLLRIQCPEFLTDRVIVFAQHGLTKQRGQAS